MLCMKVILSNDIENRVFKKRFIKTKETQNLDVVMRCRPSYFRCVPDTARVM